MAMQKNVNLYPSAAVQGDRASQNPIIYTPQNYLAGDNVKVGTFVWLNSEATDPMTVKNTGTGAPLGFVERTLSGFDYNVSEDGTLVIAKGEAVTVAIRGDFYVPANTTVTVGMAAFANTTTGAVTFAASGSSQSGAVETAYRAMTAGKEGDMIIISNEAAVVAATAATAELSGYAKKTDLETYAKADLSNVTGTLDPQHGGTGQSDVGSAAGEALVTKDSGTHTTEWKTIQASEAA